MLDHARILDWFAQHRRDLPWRSSTPYGVLVSEFMLQQTPVSRVLPIWNTWMQTWPTPLSLANATRADLLRAWGGLGYPRRAIRLHQSAQAITELHGGEVPETIAQLRALPGVGEYTAAAIAAFAFKASVAVLDINVRRLFSRAVLGINAPGASVTHRERDLATQMLPTKQAHVWSAATMELGALVCTARSPRCSECPIATDCQWRLAGYPITVVARSQQWQGTDRQCRGALMRVLREQPTAVNASVMEAAWSDALQRGRCLDQLIREGLLEPLPDRMYALPN